MSFPWEGKLTPEEIYQQCSLSCILKSDTNNYSVSDIPVYSCICPIFSFLVYGYKSYLDDHNHLYEMLPLTLKVSLSNG